jgi:cytochrome c
MNWIYVIIGIALLYVAGHVRAEGDANRGQQLYGSRCIGCHSIDSHRVGPAHQGVFGRRVGTAPGYVYSEALMNSTIIWTAQNLEQWLSDPEAVMPGQKMWYSVSDPTDRADLIAYLITVSPQASAAAEVGGKAHDADEKYTCLE